MEHLYKKNKVFSQKTNTSLFAKLYPFNVGKLK